jgi:hypothetical protein
MTLGQDLNSGETLTTEPLLVVAKSDSFNTYYVVFCDLWLHTVTILFCFEISEVR